MNVSKPGRDHTASASSRRGGGTATSIATARAASRLATRPAPRAAGRASCGGSPSDVRPECRFHEPPISIEPGGNLRSPAVRRLADERRERARRSEVGPPAWARSASGLAGSVAERTVTSDVAARFHEGKQQVACRREQCGHMSLTMSMTHVAFAKLKQRLSEYLDRAARRAAAGDRDTGSSRRSGRGCRGCRRRPWAAPS